LKRTRGGIPELEVKHDHNVLKEKKGKEELSKKPLLGTAHLFKGENGTFGGV